MVIKYKFTDKISKEVVDKLLHIKDTKGLTAEEIVYEAKKSKSVLHNLFDWDNTSAANKYRLQQARILVNEVRVIIEEKEFYAFENVNVTIDKADTQETVREYKTVVEILSNEKLRMQVIMSALNHLEYWEKQNERYTELSPIIAVAGKVRSKLQVKWLKKKK